MDFFDDDEPPTAPPAFKFQPKAKPKARAAPSKKAPSAAKPSAPRQAADNQHVASPTKANMPSDDISDSAVREEQTTSMQTSSSADPLVSSMENISTITGQIEENATSMDGGNQCESTVDNSSTITGHREENATSKDCGNQCDNTGESMVENAEAFVRLDSVDDPVPQSTSVAEDLTNSPTPVKKKQLSSKDTVASNDAGDTQVKRGQLETKGGHAFTSSESFDLVSEVGASSGKRASKFKSTKKPGKKKVLVSASDPKDTFVVPSETQNINQDSADGGPDFPDVRVDDAFSIETECMLNQDGLFETSPDLPSCTNAATDCPLNQASQFLQSPSGFAAEASDQVNVNGAENNNGHNEEEGQPEKRKSSSRSNKDANGTRKSARKRKKTIKGLEISNEETTKANEETTEPNEETIEANEETTEASEKTNEDAIGTRKTPRKRKTKKQALEKSNEETTEALEKPNEEPPKKFPRGTRRRHRCLDQSLLETPEDEIDYQSLPIKDLILLAEHRERQLALEKKADTSQPVMPAEEATAPAEPVKKTNDNVWGDGDYDDYDDMDDPAQGGGSFDGPSTSAVERDTTYFNYHSHMNRTPRVKWTKQDTVLFYEGVRQFGSDLSMIQHLFPGRTRQQIKLKYKKEERQKPMELLDALANRAKDLTHYKLVIGRLQEKIDREEEQMPEEEGSLGTSGNEGDPEEGTADDTQEQTQDEAAKSEQNGDGVGAVEDPVEGRVGSPAESTESDLDTGDWGEYKSTF